ncbi:arrestin red cell-like isoform X2 [Oscarella lobularis]|uniref:arrestin red cell-like isoform X2 n=1 Tax=Oscarella lobularis TaxID=121494 RepID=UPI00331317E0
MSDEDSDHRSGSGSHKKRPGVRVFKKTSPNGKITVYVGKRDFIDHNGVVDPIDGVVLVETDGLGLEENDGKRPDKKVFIQVLSAFRHGREDLDVLGLSFRKDLYEDHIVLYPRGEGSAAAAAATATAADDAPKTKLQERLIRKLGAGAIPFVFQLPAGIPASVTLQPAAGDTGKPCGIDYELRTFVAESATDKPERRSSVRLGIKKLFHASNDFAVTQEQPAAEISKSYFMSGVGDLYVEARLDKAMYCHGEEIKLFLNIQNRSGKTVRRLKIAARQFAEICLFSTAQYKCTVASIETDSEGFPISPGQSLYKTYILKPLLQANRDKRGLALDGQLKHEDTNLASSTIVSGHIPMTTAEKQRLGIIVQYKIKIRCVVGFGGDVVLEVPFILSSPKPTDVLSPIRGVAQVNSRAATRSAASQAGYALAAPILGMMLSQKQENRLPGGSDTTAAAAAGNGRRDPGIPAVAASAPAAVVTTASAAAAAATAAAEPPVDNTLVQLDYDDHLQVNDEDVDLIFEEFVRLRAGGESEA